MITTTIIFHKDTKLMQPYQKRIYFLFIKICMFLLLIGACTKNKSKNINCTHKITENLITKLKTSQKFSDIFTCSDTLTLETHPDGLIGSIYKVAKHPDGFIIMDNYIVNQVFMFKNDGSFNKILGGKGKGPGELMRPDDIYVDEPGNIYILDSSLRRILKFDNKGNHLTDLSLHELNISPARFLIRTIADKQRFFFYNLDADFAGKSKNRKIIAADFDLGKFSFQYAFGTHEPLLQKLLFSTGAFEISPRGEFWLGQVFDLNIELFNLTGEKLMTINEHYQSLPEPFISPEELKQFNRPSESLDTYYKLTRLSEMVILDEVVLVCFLSNHFQWHFYFYDFCGNYLGTHIICNKRPFPSKIVGSWNNKFYVALEAEDLAPNTLEVPNPRLIGYEIVK